MGHPFYIPHRVVYDEHQAQSNVKNVFCVGRNYANHAKELGNDVPKTPMIFGKSTHTVVPATGMISLPQDRDTIHHELEIVLWIGKSFTPGCSYRDIVSGVALGLDLTDREAQSKLKAAGHPWELAKGFKGSAVLTRFVSVADWDALLETPFSLQINGRTVQQGIANDMIFDFQTLVDYVGTHFGLEPGDVLFTGTPEGVGPMSPGDSFVLRYGDEVWGECSVS